VKDVTASFDYWSISAHSAETPDERLFISISMAWAGTDWNGAFLQPTTRVLRAETRHLKALAAGTQLHLGT
jgi:hypothetical protein